MALMFSAMSHAQIEGKWKTIDDETGQAKSIVEIFKSLTENTMVRWYSYLLSLLTLTALYVKTIEKESLFWEWK